MTRKLARAGALGAALAAAASILGCGQTTSDATPEASGGAPATGSTTTTGGAQTGGVPARAGGAGGTHAQVPPLVPETTFRIVNDTDATIYVQLPSRFTIRGITVSGEYQGAHDLGDDAPLCLDCPIDTCPQWERTPFTVEAIEPGATWERVWDGYLYNRINPIGGDFCMEKRPWRGATHTAEICWGTGFTSEFEDRITGESCLREQFVLGDTVVHTVTN